MTVMRRKLYLVLLGILLMAVAVPTARAALDGLGNPIDPHGFPAFYRAGGLSLELCLPPPAGHAALRSDLCTFDPLPGGPLQVAGESFWWMANAQAPSLVPQGKALLTLALEAAFSEGGPVDGQQMSFGRVRIRIDVPTPGTYTVTFPFGTLTFENVTVADGINYTSDIGGINIINPALGFQGALASPISFLRWPGYATDQTLQARAKDLVTGLPAGPVLEQYIGNPAIPHVVTGGTNANLFRVQGPGGIDVQTDLFTVMGKVYDPAAAQTVHVFPNAPVPNLFAVGPVNRGGVIGPVTPQQPEGVRAGQNFLGYPVGYPLWYQENAGTVALPAGGTKLTFCPPSDPMCISAPIETANPNSVALRIGEEGFWWTSEAFINDRTTDAQNVPAGLDGLLVLALEAAFAGTGAPAPGQQVGFARLRIRIDTPVAGTYRVTHPYGEEEFTNVPAGRRTINMTRDIMVADVANPDNAFTGTLYGTVGPRFLTWPDFANPLVAGNAVLQKPYDPADPLSPLIQYVGDPATPHAVTGSPNGTNYFRIRGPGGIDVRTSLFAVSGKVFDPATFNVTVNPSAPVANADAATLNLSLAPSVTINVLANDTFQAPAVPATVNILPAGGAFGPDGGSVAVNADRTVTYTPNAGFGGVDTFAYQVTDSLGLTSANAIVTVTVQPVETLALRRAQLQLRRLQLNLQGTSNIDGTTLTIHAGPTADGPVLGQARVAKGRWSFRGTTTTNLTSISIVSSSGKTLLNQPVQVR